MRPQDWIALVCSAVIAFLYWAFRSRDPRSQFAKREHERLRPSFGKGADSAHARRAQDPRPLRLEGFASDRAPHEILGISSIASELEIQRAYRELMKRYHPDRIGAPGSREWQDAQAIAAALTDAKNAMLERLKRRG